MQTAPEERGRAGPKSVPRRAVRCRYGYFLGQLKASVARALCDVFHRQRRAAALEWAIRQPNKAIFEVRPRGRLQRQLIAGARDEL